MGSKDTCLYWWPHNCVLNRNNEVVIPEVIALFIVSLNLRTLMDTWIYRNGNRRITQEFVMILFTGDPTVDSAEPGMIVLSVHKWNMLLMDHRSKWPSIAERKLHHLWILKRSLGKFSNDLKNFSHWGTCGYCASVYLKTGRGQLMYFYLNNLL